MYGLLLLSRHLYRFIGALNMMYVYINSKNNVTVLLYPVWGYIWLVTITCNSIYYLYLNIVLMTWWNVTFYKVAYGATCMQMFPDNAVKREMARMPTKCSYPFCTWTGIFRDYEVQYIAALVFFYCSHILIYIFWKSQSSLDVQACHILCLLNFLDII